MEERDFYTEAKDELIANHFGQLEDFGETIVDRFGTEVVAMMALLLVDIFAYSAINKPSDHSALRGRIRECLDCVLSDRAEELESSAKEERAAVNHGMYIDQKIDDLMERRREEGRAA